MRNEAKKGSVYFADDDARNRIRGIPDYKVPLTYRGREQARQTGLKLREFYETPDYLYHSGYTRTIETTEGILAAYAPKEREQIKLRENPFIRERDPGYAYDMTQTEAEENFPWLQEHWHTFGGFFARPPGGESLSDVANRVYTFLNMLFRDRAGQNVFVVTHGGTLRAFRFLLERWDYDRALHWPDGHAPQNCGVTDYEYDPPTGRLILPKYDTVHWCE
jgi:probable phosphoglycerate mutase